MFQQQRHIYALVQAMIVTEKKDISLIELPLPFD